jgi:hypothetical protein
LSPLVWAGAGVLVGAAAMLVFSRLVPFRPSNPKFAALPPAAQSNVPPKQSTTTLPANPSSTTANPPSSTTGQPNTSAGVSPLDPFGSNHALAIPPPSPLKGHITGPILPSAAVQGSRPSPGGQAGVPQTAPQTGSKPGKGTTEPVNQPIKEVKNTVQLLTLSASVGDPAVARRELSAWARRAGGSAQTFQTYDDKYESPVDGLLVFVPEAKLSEFMKFDDGLGQTSLDETWVGSSGERRSRLTSQASVQLEALRKKKDELRRQYEDDASQVKHATEGIEILTKSLGQLRPPKSSDGLEAVRVLLVPKSAQARFRSDGAEGQ